MSFSFIRCISCCVAVLVLLESELFPATAMEPDWDKDAGNYIVINQDIRSILEEISNHIGVPAFVSDDIKGKVNEKIESGSFKHMIETLTRRYGFTWYYDGGKLYFSSLKESISQIMPIGQVQFDHLRRQLADLEVLDDRFDLRYSASGRSVFVSGPPRYAELVRQGIEAANAQIGVKQSRRGIDVIYGRGGSR